MVTFTNNALLSYTYPGNPEPIETQSNDVTTTLLDACSLTVQKTTTPGTYRLGETVTYLVLLTNTGSQPLTTLTLTDTEIWGRILANIGAGWQPALFASNICINRALRDKLCPEVGFMRLLKAGVCLLLCLALSYPVRAEGDFIRWVDFDLSCEVMSAALEIDQRSWEQEAHLSWIDILALAATRHGSGTFGIQAVRAAAEELRQDKSPAEFLGSQYRYFAYWQEAYSAVLGGLLGSYAIEVNGQWKPSYGLKAFSPIAAGYWYAHYDDFGQSRSYGFARRHLGNDLLGALGTPICAVEDGVVEALGWNQYGGWRVGIRSHDGLRYWYYAHLQKGRPFAAGLQEGDVVQAGQVIGYMGRTGYSLIEDTNNIETVHLHFGLQLIFDESQKDGNGEIWVDVYQLVRLLERHRCTVSVLNGEATRAYSYRDLDRS